MKRNLPERNFGWFFAIVLIVTPFIISFCTPNGARAAPCGDVAALVRENGWIYHNPINDGSGGHVVEVTATSTNRILPADYEAIGNRHITLLDTNRTMDVGWWSIYPKCGQTPPTQIPTGTPPPTATARPVIQPPAGEYCSTDDKIAEYMGVPTTRIHRDLFDGVHADPSGWRVDDGDPINWIPPLNYAVQYDGVTFSGDGQTQIRHRGASVWMPDSCRTPKPTPTHTPTIVQPTPNPQGLVCLTHEQLAAQLGLPTSWIHFVLRDDQNRLAGWFVDLDGNKYVTWTIPKDWVLQFGTGAITGTGQTISFNSDASIWMPVACRSGGVASTPTLTPSPTSGFTVSPPTPNTPVPSPTPVATLDASCGQIVALAAKNKWTYVKAVDNGGHVVEVKSEFDLPLRFEAIGADANGAEIRIGPDTQPRKLTVGTWTIYGKCDMFLPVVTAAAPQSTASQPVAQPTPNANGIVCLKTEQLAAQIKIGTSSNAIEASWLTFDLRDDKNRLSGWRLVGDGRELTWKLPTKWELQFSNGTLVGDGTKDIGFSAASIWMPQDCRK